MEYSELIAERYSVRAYQSRPIKEEDLRQVLDAARLAPTAANRQPFQIIVIRTEGREQELRRIYSPEWFVQAPIVIAAVGVPAKGWTRRDGKSYNDVDVAIAMDHLILAAANLGLGTCWVGAFNADAAREVLGLPDDVEPIAFTPLGYAADEPGPKQRKPLKDLVRYGRWHVLDIPKEISGFIAAFEEKADPEYRAGNQSVIRTGLKMYGVRVPALRRIAREWKRGHKGISFEELMPLVEALWDGDSLAERSLAMELLHAYRRFISKLSWDHFDCWRRKIDNWGLTDFLGTRILGRWIEADPDARLDRLLELIDDEDRWSRRLAVVATCPLNRGHSRVTIPDLTLQLIDRVKGERDPMITKAVSWALRELSQTHPDRVAAYVEQERDALAAHVVREVENKLRTGLKSGKARE